MTFSMKTSCFRDPAVLFLFPLYFLATTVANKCDQSILNVTGSLGWIVRKSGMCGTLFHFCQAQFAKTSALSLELKEAWHVQPVLGACGVCGRGVWGPGPGQNVAFPKLFLNQRVRGRRPYKGDPPCASHLPASLVALSPSQCNGGSASLVDSVPHCLVLNGICR